MSLRRGLSRTAKFEECDIHRNLPKIQYFLGLISALVSLWHEQKKTRTKKKKKKPGRSSLVLRNGLNCRVWMFSYPDKKIVSNFSWKKYSNTYKSGKRIQPYKQSVCNYENIWLLEFDWHYRGGSRRRVQGVRTPPEMTCGFLIQLVFCKKNVVYWCWSRARDECTPS